MSGEEKRAADSRHKHDEKRGHGRDEERVQTPGAGARSGLTLDICGHFHNYIQQRRDVFESAGDRVNVTVDMTTVYRAREREELTDFPRFLFPPTDATHEEGLKKNTLTFRFFRSCAIGDGKRLKV